MDEKRIDYLVDRYLQGALTATEQVEFQQMLVNPGYHGPLKGSFDRLVDEVRPSEVVDETLLPLLTQLLESDRVVVERSEDTGVRVRKVWNTVWFRSVAAVLILAFGIGLWQWRTPSDERDYLEEVASTIPPGGNKAVLTLSDGRTMSLDDWGKDTVVSLGGTTLLNDGNESLVYKKVDDGYLDLTNTVSTPKGGEYRVVLADGTKVFLNAESSITFPLVFAKDKREVKLTGEAYFEVNTVTTDAHAPGRKTPFIVTVNDIEVEVLGTRFNINAFAHDGAAVQTTLLEGAVEVSSAGRSTRIQPGQQTVYNYQTGQFDVSDADIGHIMAWKEGRFDFNGTLVDIMGQVGRWYDMEVLFEPGGQYADKLFIGSISRSANLGKVLRMIQLTGDVNFKVEPNKIIVMD